MGDLYCLFCHEQNVVGVTHCVNCGAVLLPAEVNGVPQPHYLQAGRGTADMEALVQTLSPQTMVLLVDGHEEPVFLPDLDRVILGRDDVVTSLKVLDLSQFGRWATSTSRRHVMISSTATGFAVSDLGSTNGTTLNRRPLKPGKSYKLACKDRLMLGALPMVVYFKPEKKDVCRLKMILKSRNTLADEGHALRPHFLFAHLSPYLQAVNELQQIIAVCRNEVSDDLLIHKIEEKEGTVVTLDIDDSTLQVITNHIQPWRDDYTQYTGLKQRSADDDLQDSIAHLAYHIVDYLTGERPSSPTVTDRLQDCLLVLTTSKLEPLFAADDEPA